VPLYHLVSAEILSSQSAKGLEKENVTEEFEMTDVKYWFDRCLRLTVWVGKREQEDVLEETNTQELRISLFVVGTY